MNPKLYLAALAVLLPVAAAAQPAETPAPSASGAWETGHFSLIPRSFQSDPRLDVIIHTDFTAEGAQQPQASLADPVYYTGSDGGLVNVGEIIAGERVPAASELAKILVAALHESGFKPSDAAHPPTVFIHYRWGSFNRLEPLGGGRDDLDYANFLERAALVGGTKFAITVAQDINAGTLDFFENSNPRVNFLVQEARDNRYFIIASAYDYAAALEGKVRLLWSTKISTNSRGVMMNESLPQLVASAAPYFGHPTPEPVRLNRPVVKPGQVTIGTLTIKEMLPPDENLAPPPAAKSTP